jgi:hypothetical protein
VTLLFWLVSVLRYNTIAVLLSTYLTLASFASGKLFRIRFFLSRTKKQFAEKNEKNMTAPCRGEQIVCDGRVGLIQIVVYRVVGVNNICETRGIRPKKVRLLSGKSSNKVRPSGRTLVGSRQRIVGTAAHKLRGRQPGIQEPGPQGELRSRVEPKFVWQRGK